MEPAEIITNGPAKSFRLPGAIGTVGSLDQITNDICARCNRMRITPWLPASMPHGGRRVISVRRCVTELPTRTSRNYSFTTVRQNQGTQTEDGLAPVAEHEPTGRLMRKAYYPVADVGVSNRVKQAGHSGNRRRLCPLLSGPRRILCEQRPVSAPERTPGPRTHRGMRSCLQAPTICASTFEPGNCTERGRLLDANP